MRISACILLWLVSAASAFAGPPYVTDDPVPVGYLHSEFYLFSAGTNEAGGVSGVGPAVEYNYGILPNTMFHIIAPFAYDSPDDQGSHFGYGDTELGLKYQLIHGSDGLPMMGIFPLVEIPTGDQDKGLGNGKAQYFLPVWLQQDFGQWTAYGGGGYWINTGAGNSDYWFSGILVQYAFSEGLTVGSEIFHQTADTVDGKGNFNFNSGGTVPLMNGFQLLFSAGRGLTHTSGNRFSYYVSVYRDF